MTENISLDTVREHGRIIYDKLRLLTHPLALRFMVDNLPVGKIGHPVTSLLPDVPDNLTPAWPYLRNALSKKEPKEK
jgi:hypothetical protein